MKLVRLAALGVGVAALVAFAGVGRPDRAKGDPPPSLSDHAITVNGTGSVKATPDQADFSFGVTTQAKTATQALGANSTEMGKVIAALKRAGVAAANIQTSSVSLSPVFSPKGDAIVGYTASNTVSATIKNISGSGAVIDAAVSAGANQVGGPFLTLSDQDALYRQALKAAVADARNKAQTLAAAAGIQLGSVRSVIEGGGAPPPVPYASNAKGGGGPPIEPGTQEISASVTVIYNAT